MKSITPAPSDPVLALLPSAADFAGNPAILVVLLVLALGLLAIIARRRPARTGWHSASRCRAGGGAAPDARVVALDGGRAPLPPAVSPAAAQLDAVAAAGFRKRRLLNKEESRMLYLLEEILRDHGRGHRLMCQTSLGEVLATDPGSASPEALDRAFRAINAKRLDFCIVDRGGFLVVAIEYQGSGHYAERAFMSDAVKREALRKAGVPMIELTPHDTAETLRRVLAPLLRPAASAAS